MSHPVSDETLPQERSVPVAQDSGDAWRVTVVRHARFEHVGASAAIASAGAWWIGRHAEWLGVGVLADERTSRRHAELTLQADGSLAIADLGSHNGTLVGGERIDGPRVLREGDVLSFGGVSLLVHRRPVGHVPLRSGGSWIEASAPMCALAREVEHWASSRECLAIVGEPGTGRSTIARRIHERSGRRGKLVVISAASLGDELALTTLHGNEAGAYAGAIRERAGLFEEADGGTLVVDGLDAARPSLATALATFLDRGEVARVGGSAARSVDVRVLGISDVVPSAASRSGGIAPALAAHFGLAVLRVPPLRERKEDVPLIVGCALRGEAAGEPPRLDEPLVRALLAHDWPGNVRELVRWGVGARREVESSTLALTPALASSLGADELLVREAARGGRPVLARSGAFFADGGGRRVDFESRRALRGIVARLVAGAVATDAKRLTVDDLFAAGWPGERASASAAATRVYGALATLRREGLKELIGRDADGYFLGPRDAFDVVEV